MEKCPVCGKNTLTFEPDPQFPKQKEAGHCPCTPQGAVISRPTRSETKQTKVDQTKAEVKTDGDTK